MKQKEPNFIAPKFKCTCGQKLKATDPEAFFNTAYTYIYKCPVCGIKWIVTCEESGNDYENGINLLTGVIEE
jgi:hypothetical protein